jgi:hypothetical protein
MCLLLARYLTSQPCNQNIVRNRMTGVSKNTVFLCKVSNNNNNNNDNNKMQGEKWMRITAGEIPEIKCIQHAQ